MGRVINPEDETNPPERDINPADDIEREIRLDDAIDVR